MRIIEKCGLSTFRRLVAIAVAAVLSFSGVMTVEAQTGTTVSINLNNGSLIKNNNASSYYAFWRHNQVPLVLTTSNSTSLTNGLFTTPNNNMNIYNGHIRDAASGKNYFSITLPKGYRILNYTLKNAKSETTITPYVNGLSTKLSGNVSDKKVNALYFEANGQVEFSEFTVTYVVDQYYTVSLPSNNASSFNTGIIDLGTITSETNSVYSDIQSASVYNANSASTTATISSNTYTVSANGDYMVEAPQDLRIVGANLTFSNSNAVRDGVRIYSTVSSISASTNMVVGDGNGHYLTVTNGALANTNNIDNATLWEVKNDGYGCYLSYNNQLLGINSSSNSLSLYNDLANGYHRLRYNTTLKTFMYGNYVLTYNYGWKLVSQYGPVKAYSGCFQNGRQYKLSATDANGVNYYMTYPGVENLPYNGSLCQGYLNTSTNANDAIAWTYQDGQFESNLGSSDMYYLSGNIDWNDPEYNIVENISKTPTLTWEVDNNGRLYQNVDDNAHPGSLKGNWGGSGSAWGRRYIQLMGNQITVLYGIDYPIVNTADQDLYKNYSIDISLSSGDGNALDFPPISLKKCTIGRATPAYYVQAYDNTGLDLSVYDENGAQQSYGEATSVSSSATSTLYFDTNLNNDAIKFNVTGLNSFYQDKAKFTVSLVLEPLNPEIQKISVAAQQDGGSSHEESVEADITDHKVNNGDVINISFSSSENALNGLRFVATSANSVDDYKNKGKANPYFIGSNYYYSTFSSSDQPTETTAGTFQMSRTNSITTFNRFETNISSTNKLTGTALANFETNESKAAAGFGVLIPYGTPATRYIYTADIPRYNISSTPHIAYRVYQLNAVIGHNTVTPFVDAKSIYEDGMKISGNAVSCVDADHRFVGVKVGVKSSLYGYIGKCYISDGHGHYLTSARYGNQQTLSAGTLDDAATCEWTVQSIEYNGKFYSKFSCVKADGKTYYLSDQNIYNELNSDGSGIDVLWTIDESGHVYNNLDRGCFLHCTGEKWEMNTSAIQGWSQSISAVNFDGSIPGNIASTDIISAINEKLAQQENGKYQYTYNTKKNYTTDLCKGVLYVDMTGLSNVTEYDSWASFQSGAAANCILFMPDDNTGSYTRNVVARSELYDNYMSKSDFEIKDKANSSDELIAPFYSPYNFTTSGYKAIYKRDLNKSMSLQSTLMLPFSVALDAKGISSNDIQFCEPSSISADTLCVKAVVTGSKTETNNKTIANHPYHVSLGHHITVLAGTNSTKSTESYANLFDGYGCAIYPTGSKWCTSFDKNNPPYVIFKISEKSKLKSYTLVAGNDTQGHSERHWKNWEIYGANFGDDASAVENAAWGEPIDTQENESYQQTTSAPYMVNNAAAYQYYMIKVTAINGGGTQQMADINLTFDDEAEKTYSIDIEETNASVSNTTAKEYTSTYSVGTMYGNYYGKQVAKSTETGTQYYYYYNGRYRNSIDLSDDYPCFYADPYRSYFTLSASASKAKSSYHVVFGDLVYDANTAEIDDVKTSNMNVPRGIYTLTGIKVVGEPTQHGIYIVNGKKVLY